MHRKIIILLGCLTTVLTVAAGFRPLPAGAVSKVDYSLVPPFVSAGVPPLVMLVLGRDHKLYYEAYNDASDLDGDGTLDVGYNPAIDYYGYFDSYKEYVYDSADNRFEPVAETADKKVSAAGLWSGDYLNYLTMSRMDCLRKVLYGGYRETDTAGETVLRRAYIPQDAHSWGKEYASIARDGYDITQYTPLSLPDAGTYHLFACTTLADNGDSLLRVLPDNTHRIWEWVAKERPVCDSSLESAGGTYSGYPADHSAYEDMVMQFATAAHLQGSGVPANGQINGSGNPYGGDDYYLNIFTGELSISTGGTYQFAVDGDDAVEVVIDGTVVAGWYNGHGACGCTTYSGNISLDAGSHDIEFRHQERTGSDSYYLRWSGPDSGGTWELVPAAAFSSLIQTTYDVQVPSSTITDYKVRVLVGDASMPEANCKLYPNGSYKPIGLLQRNGESERMYFGLITGSYARNTSGGVLRKNIGPITDEIDPDTGQFTAVNGIISTINKLRVVCYDYGSKSYNCSCGWITSRAINEGECRMWGNPVGEMMYEGLRYFAGKSGGTSAFLYSGITDDDTLGLPLATWNDPYNATTGYDYCAKPFMLVLSDINPSYDSDQLPGSYFSSFTGDVSGLDVSSEAAVISSNEGISGTYYIGQVGATYDGSPTPKTISSLANIRGLCPEEPTKQGSYYAAAVAYYGRTTDVSSATGEQNLVTYTVGLASPLPRIEIPVAGTTVTLVPFGKTVQAGGMSRAEGDFQPTNTIVDFFVEAITPTYGKFRINFEDVEQGADHDMDAIVEYEYVVNADDTVTVSLNCPYSSAGYVLHMGYVISGTTADGTYLEVLDYDSTGGDVDYFLDTPPGQSPGGTWNDGAELPLTATRTFTPGAAAGAGLLENPLWFAAKYGGFEEKEDIANNLPDSSDEWDKDSDGTPDTYFYVTNPLKLEEQLNKSFADILRRTASGTAASVISSSRSGEGAIYQAIFYPEFKGPLGNTVHWVGNINSLFVDGYGNMREDTNGNRTLDIDDDRVIVFDGTTVYKYTDGNADGKLEASEAVSPVAVTDITGIEFLWTANDWLGDISDGAINSQRGYGSTAQQRFIFTFVDNDGDMVVDDSTIDGTGELLEFTPGQSGIYQYLHVTPNVFDADSPAFLAGIFENGIVLDSSAFQSYADTQAERIIKFTRGEDQAEDNTGSYTIPAMRSRQVDYDDDGTVETWRLGDIVYSTPTIVGAPAESYDLLYEDGSYTDFRRRYRFRRQVVYAGANDGMLHAFNGGFFNPADNKFYLGCSATGTFNDSGLPLGAELWAYVPWNLLPHLEWLTEADYGTDYHVPCIDLKPRIFDAKIFSADADHPNGWGTVMVVGMRFGGGAITADTDRDNVVDAGEPVMRSAYLIFDISNPEEEPKPLAELAFSDLGFTTCYPTVIPMKDRDPAIDNNKWLLVLGSGPAPAAPASLGDALPEAKSTQTGKVFLVDLTKLVNSNEVWTYNSSGTLVVGASPYAELDGNAFISDPVTIDYDLDYKADVVYFGTVSGSFATGWGGKLRRLLIDNDDNPANWTPDSVLIDLGGTHSGQPIVSAPSVTLDVEGHRWLFFGTGRFFNRLDVTSGTATDQQSYYGIREPRTNPTTWSWATVTTGDLLDVSGVTVMQAADGTISVVDSSGTVSAASFRDLVTEVTAEDGWRIDFPTSMERNLGQAALLGDILTFTSYVPYNDPCVMEGYSYLYALYYKTGTAYQQSVIGLNAVGADDEVLKKTSLGLGLTITPNIHVGKEGGSKAFVQTSTGAIVGIEQANPGATKSGGVYWREVFQ
ncbi:MAG: hypothetical protein JW781_01675 [Deltaproteobacteria bacterium]|nr:hypothetical protein [Candidatus Anaeroferrophillacea bacterium]